MSKFTFEKSKLASVVIVETAIQGEDIAVGSEYTLVFEKWTVLLGVDKSHLSLV